MRLVFLLEVLIPSDVLWCELHPDKDMQAIDSEQSDPVVCMPYNCGIPGNEKAGQLAKEGSTDKQSETSVTYHQMKLIIKSIRKPQIQTQDDYHNMNRSEQVVIMRLRTGHSRLRSHMYTKFKIGNSATCTCGRAPQTAGHILQDCHEHDALRQTYNTYDKAVWTTTRTTKDSEICTGNDIADIDIKKNLMANER
jgi:hypothetical protein